MRFERYFMNSGTNVSSVVCSMRMRIIMRLLIRSSNIVKNSRMDGKSFGERQLMKLGWTTGSGLGLLQGMLLFGVVDFRWNYETYCSSIQKRYQWGM